MATPDRRSHALQNPRIANLHTLQLYHQIHEAQNRTNRDFAARFMCLIRGSGKKGICNISVWREMIDFVWSLPDTRLPSERTREPLVAWLHETGFHAGDCMFLFLSMEYLDFTLEEVAQQCSTHRAHEKKWAHEQKVLDRRSETLSHSITYVDDRWRSGLYTKKKSVDTEREILLSILRYKEWISGPTCEEEGPGEEVDAPAMRSVMEWIREYAEFLIPGEKKEKETNVM
jgi:hypothetical protein